MAARRRLRESGIEAFDLEARLLAAFASGKSVQKFLQDSRFYVTNDDFEESLGSMLDRRLRGEPVAYITGEWEFFGLPLYVTSDTLIPRPDSEVLAHAAIEILHTTARNTRCIDLCTGTGCIGIAIAAHVPNARVVLADISQSALDVARMNVKRHSMSRMVTCVEADAEQAPPMLMGRFDVLVCNPPYIPTGDIDGLDVSVKDYEPRLALDGGEDGLKFYRAIISGWSPVILSGGYLAFEVGIGQAEAVTQLLRESGFDNIITRKDSMGIDRVVLARKSY